MANEKQDKMSIVLAKKPKSPIIIAGFPGLGLIATIATEFLIKHLNAKPIGHIWSKDLLPIAAVHDSKIIQPMEIYYAEKENIVIVHALSDVRGLEWEISETLVELYKILNAKEIIAIEGILSRSESNNVYFCTQNSANKKRFESLKVPQLKEGIILGVTAGLILKDKSLDITGLFVETHSSLPDSKSAARIIEVLDGYLGLTLNVQPLIDAATQFEEKLKSLLEHSKRTLDFKKSRDINYLG